MTIGYMREHLGKLYPGWSRRLRDMSDEQVMAIFFRKQQEKPDIKKEAVKETHWVYECPLCFMCFETENPEVTECRYCGARLNSSNKHLKGDL